MPDLTAEPGRRTASRTWFCLPVAALGFAASIILGAVTRAQQESGIHSALEAKAARIAKNVERRLDEGIRPLSVLALFLETQSQPSPERFASMARKVQSFGIPVGRLAWEPRVSAGNHLAFEAEARAAGFAGYRIVRLTPDGVFVPVEPASEYFPIRLEANQAGFPDALGYDVVSEPTRRTIADLARDQGAPVAVRPHIVQTELINKPVYLIYWPLYRGSVTPGTIEERRELLSGYVTVAMTIEDLLWYALRDVLTSENSLVLQARNPGSDSVPQPVGSYDPGRGLAIHLAGLPAPRLSGQAFEHRFTLLQQDWVLTMSFPDAEFDRGRDSVPWLVVGLGMLGTLTIVGIVYGVARQAERDRGGRRRTEELMTELEHANQALIDRERASVSLVHARTRFFASASHDLRQPLHALSLFASALARRVTDANAVELVDNIKELGLSMQGMFTSLLDLSRLDTGSVEPRSQRCDIDALAVRLLAEYAPRASVKGLRVRKAGRFPSVETDPGLLESVLRNLIDNAIKFTDRGGILIAGRVRGGMPIIDVWDTGPGIPNADLDRIFEEFERLDATVQKRGFGLGLPIVRKLCALIGASVSVCSRPGHGSRFTVALSCPVTPVLSAPAACDDVHPEVARKTILLIDDDPTVLRALALELTDLGHQVYAVSNTEGGMRLIGGTMAFDMAILDLRFGGHHDGWKLVDAMMVMRPGVAVILMTGSTDASTLRRVQNSGLPTLFKPVTPESLHKIISEWG